MRFVGNMFLIDAAWALLHPPQTTSVPFATVRNGTYSGVYNPQYGQDYFLGVPFAQPPVRFSIAQGLNTTWDGIRTAHEHPVHCYGYGYDQDGFEQSEDCLYLNIVRPAGLDNDGLPVAVWLHGGGLEMGGAADPRYNLSFIVEQSVALGKPVIGVGLNYRLSAFGFLVGKEAMKEGVTNLGFRDQRLALSWINENIASFGGDPKKVTIFGESSGAESVAAQVFAYNGRNDGLFRGAMGQSGFGAPLGRYPGGFNATEATQNTYDDLVSSVPSCEKLAGSESTLDCLRRAPIEEIDIALRSGTAQRWAPVLDGDFFADYTTNQLSSGQFLKIPILLGANTDEGTSFGFRGVDNDEDLRAGIKAMMIPYEVEKTTGKTRDELVDELLELYPNDQSIGIPSLEIWPHVIQPGDVYAEDLGLQYRRVNAISGDFVMHYQRRRANEAWAKYGVPSYAYRFNIMPNGHRPQGGVGHFQEVAFVFHNINGDGYDTNPFGGNGTYPADAKAMSKTISTAWINFINGLDPNGDSGPELFNGNKWPIYKPSRSPNGKGVVFNINGTHIEVDNWRAGEKLLRIGTGCCGSVWADADSSKDNGTPSCIKREDGDPHRSITNEHFIHQLVVQSLQLNPQHARNFRIPLCRGFLKKDDEDWSLVLPRLPSGSKPCNALLSEKVHPLSEDVRKLLVSKFARGGSDQDAIINDKRNEHCLIRPYLGRRKKGWGDTNRSTFFSLRNFPLHLDRMIELGLDVQSYAKVMAEGLAFLHWVARIDANDVEFVLARSRSTSHSHPNSPFDKTLFGTHSMWIIDFDCCNPVTMDDNGAANAAECFWRNDPYYPRPGSTDTSDQELWCAFKDHYLEKRLQHPMFAAYLEKLANGGGPEVTYEAGCHCGYIGLSVALSPPLPKHEVINCNCSICRRGGYLLVYPAYEKVTWHNDSDKRVSRYQFNTKARDHMFCPKCGASIGIDFARVWPEAPRYGISVRQFNNVDLDSLQYMKLDGLHTAEPGVDLSGQEIGAKADKAPASSS
ncbi:triacylglycerol lipase II precursor [Fusarium sp. NRRL 25303]|nr:triacylglycerol lipase II precursor [Fusarium sp. NRRL 25303]